MADQLSPTGPAEALDAAVKAAQAAQAAAEKAAADPDLLTLIERLPGPLLIWLVIVALVWNRHRLAELFDRMTRLRIGEVQIDLQAFDDIRKAVDELPASTRITKTVSGAEERIVITEDDEKRAIKRASSVRPAIEGRRILWVDDLPGNNTNEMRALKQFGLQIVQAGSTAEAIEILRRDNPPVHLVLSDIYRGADSPPGTDILDRMMDEGLDIPVVFYVTVLDLTLPLPYAPGGPRAFGLTNRPDELVHLVLDALERRWPLS